jgi:hypothetical protein
MLKFPRIFFVRQNFPHRRLQDVAGEVARQLAAASFGSRLSPGARVALGVGSRGITNIATIVRSVVDYWKAQGMRPFIFPAMGSHGAATAEGQALILARYGINEQTMDCPVISQLEVVSLGKTEDGIEAFMDRVAYESSGVMLINRVKWHTNFSGAIESGLFKMMAIGIGKFAGAERYHTYAYRLGMVNMIRSVGRQVLKTGKILGGLAILEDAYHDTAKLDAVPVEGMEQREEENLALVKSWMAKIPLDLDILIIDEIGKEIAGSGMDLKVINRWSGPGEEPIPGAHNFERIFVRNLSPLSHHNAAGVGRADVVTDRLVNQVDWNATYINVLTSSMTLGARMPIHFPTDRECLERMMPTVGKFDMGDVTIGWIRNTLELAVLGLSENLKSEIGNDPTLEILGPACDLKFDRDGNLVRPQFGDIGNKNVPGSEEESLPNTGR